MILLLLLLLIIIHIILQLIIHFLLAKSLTSLRSSKTLYQNNFHGVLDNLRVSDELTGG